MDGAGLPVEPAAELFEDAVRPVEDAAVTRYGVAVPGGVLAVLGERRLHRHAERLLVDRDIDSELAQRRMQARVEVGDRETVDEVERPHTAVMGANEQRVVDEVEVDLKGRGLVMQ